MDGVEATPENVLSGAYAVARPFEMVYMERRRRLLLKHWQMSFVPYFQK